MSLLSETKSICKQYNILPSRTRGQNFLINENIYDSIIVAANLSKKDIILEVGPGLGILTRLLCKHAGKVIAVELDKKIYDYLVIAKELEKLGNLELLNKNILDVETQNFASLQAGRDDFKIVANLPYNITSIFLRKFLSGKNKPSEMILMLQKEVAQRIVAKPGKMSLLAVSVQFYAEAEIIEYVGKENFWPQPEVDSAIVKIKCTDTKFCVRINEKDFFRIVKIGFSAKRKKLVNNLANGLHKKPAKITPILEKIDLGSNIRAQELRIEDWVRLTEQI
jgi:16S rRNA (adenine1518-N6/adenine1519-N6)-dimethyltransferase